LDIEAFINSYKKAHTTMQPVSYKNIRTTKPDGRYIFTSGRLIPQIENGLFSGMICTMWDTTTSNILRNLFISALDFSPDGIGIIQQTKPGEMPSIYYMNRRFRDIFDLHNVNPVTYPFKDLLNRMKDMMKNGDTWLKHTEKIIHNNNDSSSFIIEHINSIQYKCMESPLIDDSGFTWGRICMVKELDPKMKSKKTLRKKKAGKK
jgi:hypothetical protein